MKYATVPRAVDGRIVFLDTEFDTLSKPHRQPWEIGVIIRDPGEKDVEFEWQLRPDLTPLSSPDSLRIGRYYRRCRITDKPPGTALVTVNPALTELPPGGGDLSGRLTTAGAVANQLAPALDGAFIVGLVPSADERTLDNFFPQWSHLFTGHYRIKCVETMALAYLLGRRAERAAVLGTDAAQRPVEVPGPPWDPKLLSTLIGVPVPGDDVAHRALVDARWAKDQWDAMHGIPA